MKPSNRLIGFALILCALVTFVALQLSAAEAPTPALSVVREGDRLTAIHIHGADGAVIAIMRPDGQVEVLKGEPASAAAAFWQALSGYVKTCSKL